VTRLDTNTATIDADALFREFAGPLTGFVRRRVNDQHAVDDIVADVMLRIHVHLEDLDDRERVTAWMYRIARNAITDHYRRTGRRAEHLHPTPADVSSGETAEGWVDDQDVVFTELAALLRPLVEQLPTDYRRALELTDLGSATQAEAARIESVSLSGMKSRVQRGRRQLAVMLEQRCHITLDAAGLPANCTPRDSACGCSAII
jgi:RNA polymerase sigma-70 factor (ECF subfamily)